MKKIKIESILIGVIITFLLFIAFFSTPYTDDFCLKYIKYIDKNIFTIIKDRYVEKEGRFVSIPGIIQTMGFKYLNFNTMSMIWVLFFVAIVFLFSKVYYYEITIDKIGRFLFMLVLLLIGSEGVLNDVVFWATGGSYYSVASFLMVFAIFVISKYQKNYFLFLSPLLITIGPNYSLPILFIFLIELFQTKNTTLKRKLSLAFFSILIFSFGVYILISSPGTQIRLNTVSTFWMWHPRYIIEAVSKIIYTAYSFYYLAIILTVLSILKTVIEIIKDSNSLFVKFIKLVYEFRFLIAALGSVLVFVKTPGLFSERAGYSFFLLVTIQFIYTYREFQISNFLNKFFKTISILIILVLSYTLNNVIRFNNTYFNDLKKYNSINKSDFEEKYLYNTINMPFKRFEKIEKNQNEWIGDCFQYYYEKSIGIE